MPVRLGAGTARESTPRESPGKQTGGENSDGKTLPATALTLHIGVAKAESLV
jgi:hypothetical protein